MPTEFDNLLKDLDASLDEIKTGSHPNEPKTVSQVLQLPNSLSGTMEVIPPTHPDPLNQTKTNAVPWVPRFFILTSDTLFMFVSSGPAEPVLDQFKITSQTEAIPSLGYLPGNPMAFEVADGFFQKSWILKAPSKTAKDTWMESIRIATPPGRNEDDLFEYLDEYADQDSENTAVSRKQNIQAFKEHQRYRGVPIAISRANSVGSSVQQSFSPPANFQLQLNWERRDSESTFDDSFGGSRKSVVSTSGGSGSVGSALYPPPPPLAQAGIPGGGVFGSSSAPSEPFMQRSWSTNSGSGGSGAEVRRKKSTSKAQIAKAFIQF